MDDTNVIICSPEPSVFAGIRCISMGMLYVSGKLMVLLKARSHDAEKTKMS